MVYLEEKTYNRAEIEDFLRVKPEDTYTLKERLAQIGFSEETYTYTRDSITFSWTPTKPKDKIVYLVKLLGIDNEVNAKNFAFYLYSFFTLGLFQPCARPSNKAKKIKKFWNIEIDEKTIERWHSGIMRVMSAARGNYWIGEPPRYIKCNYKYCGELLNELCAITAEYIAMPPFAEEDNIFRKLWSKYQRVYYNCPDFNMQSLTK